ncbi:MAG: ABC transporter ATP-binding protein [Oscillospiraceae bacterium]|nr:ABC transporter ATP-binding protein [Oscillospiraceae bacterium]
MRKENITKRAFKLYHSFNKKYFPLSFLQIVFSSISPYFNLWMSAEIVTALYEEQGRQTIFMLVVVTLFGNLFFHIMNAMLSYTVNLQLEILNNNESLAFNRKTLSLDYDKLEDPEIRTLRRKIRENGYINNYGILQMRETVNLLVQSGVNIMFSMIFFIEMITKIATVGFQWLGLVFLLGMILFAVLQNLWMKKFGTMHSKFWIRVSDMMLRENRLSRGMYCSGMDSRIYLQGIMIRKMEEKLNKDHLKAFSEGNSFDFKMGVPNTILTLTSTLFNFLLVCFFCTLGAFSVGSVIKYTGYLERFMIDLATLIAVPFRAFKENEQFLKLYLEYFDIPNDMYQGSLAVEKRSDKKYDIEFKNVSFKYAGSEKYALKNVNLTFKVGERLAVVGMNGSGKTTFIKLMCRLYDPTEGEIYMNDFNIRKYDYRQYLDLFSVVFQDYSLLALPLGNNVSSASAWDTKKAESCLKEVGFGERYDDMPKRLETPIYKNFDDEGVNISGGEAQKIALARALYKDSPFIILDEPTAALDPIAEAEIYAKFDELVGDKTAIYISHRLSSCRFCDKIVVFDNGEIVQVGSHNELLADENGKYYELWTAQAQYYTT